MTGPNFKSSLRSSWAVKLVSGAALAALLSACGNETTTGASDGYMADTVYNESAEMMAPPAPTIAKQSASRPQAPLDVDAPGNPSAQSFLAYRYNYAFALPAKSVAATAQSHAEQCMAAGPSVCQVLSSTSQSYAEDNVNARLSLRAEPEWLEGFTAAVISSVENAKGEVTSRAVSAEDLTRQILDTDARLNAQKTLRTRLETLLATKDAKLEDLLALERELARVQGGIESATTTLNVLRKRVSMSVVDMNYQSQQTAVSRSAFSPIGRAFKNFAGNASESLAGVISFISYALPWLILILPAAWLLRRMWRRRRDRRQNS